jgi:hypothetical protein
MAIRDVVMGAIFGALGSLASQKGADALLRRLDDTDALCGLLTAVAYENPEVVRSLHGDIEAYGLHAVFPYQRIAEVIRSVALNTAVSPPLSAAPQPPYEPGWLKKDLDQAATSLEKIKAATRRVTHPAAPQSVDDEG